MRIWNKKAENLSLGGVTLYYSTLHLNLLNGIIKEMGGNEWLVLSNVIGWAIFVNYISVRMRIITLLSPHLSPPIF